MAVRANPAACGGVHHLEERTAKSGEAVMEFPKSVPLGSPTSRRVDQLKGCGTSIGARCVEADDAVAKRKFIKIIGACRRQARACKFFLRMLVKACPGLREAAIPLWREANDLRLIFFRIRRTSQEKLKIPDESFIRHSAFDIRPSIFS